MQSFRDWLLDFQPSFLDLSGFLSKLGGGGLSKIQYNLNSLLRIHQFSGGIKVALAKQKFKTKLSIEISSFRERWKEILSVTAAVTEVRLHLPANSQSNAGLILLCLCHFQPLTPVGPFPCVVAANTKLWKWIKEILASLHCRSAGLSAANGEAPAAFSNANVWLLTLRTVSVLCFLQQPAL